MLKMDLQQFFLDKDNKLARQFMPPDEVTKYLLFLDNIKQWCKKYCKIKSIPTALKINRKDKFKMETYLGKEFVDPLLASCGQKNTVLLCEDVNLSMFGKPHFNFLRIRLLDVIEYLHKQYIIDDTQIIQFKARLVGLNQSYISIDHKVLLYLLKESDYSINDIRFQRGLFFLSAESKSTLKSVIKVLTDFLISLFQEPSILNYHKNMVTAEVLDKACLNRDESSRYIANQLVVLVHSRTILLPFLHDDIIQAIKEWERLNIYP